MAIWVVSAIDNANYRLVSDLTGFSTLPPNRWIKVFLSLSSHFYVFVFFFFIYDFVSRCITISRP